MDANVRIDVFVLGEDIRNNFWVRRDDTLDDESFQENCDCKDMSPYDKDIAVIQSGSLRLELSTTCDRWNVYLTVHDGKSTIECENVTLESKEWKSIADIVNYLIEAGGF